MAKAVTEKESAREWLEGLLRTRCAKSFSIPFPAGGKVHDLQIADHGLSVDLEQLEQFLGSKRFTGVPPGPGGWDGNPPRSTSCQGSPPLSVTSY